MRIRATPNGLAVLSASLVLLAYALACSDIILYALALGLLALLAIDASALCVLSRLQKCVIDVDVEAPQGRVLKLRDRPRILLRASCRGLCGVEEVPWWLRVEGYRVTGDRAEYVFRAWFPHTGVYELRSVAVLRCSPLGFFQLASRFPVNVSFRVAPEAVYWLTLALRALRGGYVGGTVAGLEGEELRSLPLRSVSDAGEYFETREYTPGDSLRRVDWKATMRLQRLMVKEYRVAQGGKLLMVYDDECLGPATCDAIASIQLSLALRAYHSTTSIVLLDAASGVTLYFREPRDLLLYVVKRVVERHAPVLELFEFIEPPTASELKRLVSRVPEAKRRKTSLKLVEGVSEGVIAWCIPCRSGALLDIVEELVSRRLNVVVVVPASPWLDARDDMEAEAIRRSYSLVLRKLRRLGANVILWGAGGRGSRA